jgi:hypothetical protein
MNYRDATMILAGDRAQLLFHADANLVGELLRALMFPAEDEIGCYTSFEVCDQARPLVGSERSQWLEMFFGSELTGDLEEDAWACESMAEIDQQASAYQWETAGLTVTMLFYWDGDGVLLFHLRDDHQQRVVISYDCKKDYVWKDEALPTVSEGDLANL